MTQIALTCGDPQGIGPELIAKSLESLSQYTDVQWLLYIDRDSLANDYFKAFDGWQSLLHTKQYKNIQICEIDTAKPLPKSADIAYQSLQKACEAAKAGEVAGMVTAPLSKESIMAAGYDFIDHTHYLAKACNTETRMAFHSSYFHVILDSIHIPLKEVPVALNQAHLQKTMASGYHFCLDLGIQEPKIGVAGLNPHAGENGAFGTEEKEIIQVAIHWAQQEFPRANFQGPIPADTLFHKAYHKHFDLLVTMYHDQALAPLKMIAFDEAVNVTLGLPFVRTSPDHGTAFEIAYQHKAKADSYLSACKLAVELCTKKNV